VSSALSGHPVEIDPQAGAPTEIWCNHRSLGCLDPEAARRPSLPSQLRGLHASALPAGTLQGLLATAAREGADARSGRMGRATRSATPWAPAADARASEAAQAGALSRRIAVAEEWHVDPDGAWRRRERAGSLGPGW
jgi:hypothetical protein